MVRIARAFDRQKWAMVEGVPKVDEEEELGNWSQWDPSCSFLVNQCCTYCTVYDWNKLKVGFALANNKANSPDFSLTSKGIGELPGDMERLLMQQQMSVQKCQSLAEMESEDDDSIVFFQVSVVFHVRVSVAKVL